MSTLLEAQSYVGTNELCGSVQLEILKREGLLPHHHVLEIGCGCLSAGMHLIRSLNVGCYAGIEPNAWLVNAAMTDQSNRAIADQSEAVFLHNFNFDSILLNRQFDFVLSHSVLSHCDKAQIVQYLGNVARIISSTGKVVASFRLTDPNEYGSSGSPDGKESSCSGWQYPGTTFYRYSTIADIANANGFISSLRPQHTQLLTSLVPKDFHDWVVFERL